MWMLCVVCSDLRMQLSEPVVGHSIKSLATPCPINGIWLSKAKRRKSAEYSICIQHSARASRYRFRVDFFFGGVVCFRPSCSISSHRNHRLCFHAKPLFPITFFCSWRRSYNGNPHITLLTSSSIVCHTHVMVSVIFPSTRRLHFKINWRQ